MKHKQEYRTETDGVRHAVCTLCGKIVRYPEGLFTRSGLELHRDCVRQRRIKAIKNQGVNPLKTEKLTFWSL